MFDRLESHGRGSSQVPGTPLPGADLMITGPTRRIAGQRKQVFSKVFRWRLPAGRMNLPALVQVVGSFTQWEPVDLVRQHAQDSWQVVIDQIPNDRTHHYMLLVDGKPVHDIHCDGLAVPASPEETRFQIQTDKGPRVLVLFAQTQ